MKAGRLHAIQSGRLLPGFKKLLDIFIDELLCCYHEFGLQIPPLHISLPPYWQREINKQAFRTVSLTQSDIHIANATDVPTALPHTPHGSQAPRTDGVNQEWHSCTFNILFHVSSYQALTPTFLSWLSGTHSQLTLNDVTSSLCSGNKAQ